MSGEVKEEDVSQRFSHFWNEVCEFHSLPTALAEQFRRFLFHQRLGLLELIDFLFNDDPTLTFQSPLVLALANCLLTYWDFIRKFVDAQGCNSMVLSCLKVFHSLGSSVFYLLVLFEIKCRHLSTHCLPKLIRRSATKCISIIGFNCSIYEAMVSDQTQVSSNHFLSQKFKIMFAHSQVHSPLKLSSIIEFFRQSYYHLVPSFFDNLFGDIDDTDYTVHHDQKGIGEPRIIQKGVPDLKSRQSSKLHVNTLSTNSDTNGLLSRSRKSPMNGHRIALESKLLQHRITISIPNSSCQSTSNIDNELRKAPKRVLNCSDVDKDLSLKCRRRTIIEETPIKY